MSLILDKQLLINFDTLVAGSIGSEVDLKRFDQNNRDSVLQFVHDFMLLDNDQIYVSDSRYKQHINRQLQLAIGLHCSVLLFDTPAGTGSLSGKNIDSYSVSYTMAKNNAPFNDWLNMTQYGTRFLELMRRTEFETRLMIC